MTELVNPSEIERIVGVERDKFVHYARLDSKDWTVYILHSQGCLDFQTDLRNCPMSLCLDREIDPEKWSAWVDKTVRVITEDGKLIPIEERQHAGTGN